MTAAKNKGPSSGNAMVGIILICLWIVALGGIAGAIAALFQANFLGVGACLTASALSCGLMLNAFLRT